MEDSDDRLFLHPFGPTTFAVRGSSERRRARLGPHGDTVTVFAAPAGTVTFTDLVVSLLPQRVVTAIALPGTATLFSLSLGANPDNREFRTGICGIEVEASGNSLTTSGAAQIDRSHHTNAFSTGASFDALAVSVRSASRRWTSTSCSSAPIRADWSMTPQRVAYPLRSKNATTSSIPWQVNRPGALVLTWRSQGGVRSGGGREATVDPSSRSESRDVGIKSIGRALGAVS